MNISSEIVESVKNIPGTDLSKLKIRRIVFGLFYSGVILSDGSAGICMTPISRIFSDKSGDEYSKVKSIENSFYSLTAAEAAELYSSDYYLERTFGAAVLNAFCDLLYKNRGIECPADNDLDTLDVLKIKENEKVAMVGAFPSFIQNLKEKVQKLTVIDNNPFLDTCLGVKIHKDDRGYEMIGKSDVVIITSTAFSNGSLDELLEMTSPKARVAVVGPSAGPWPLPFFKRNVTLFGSAAIKDAEGILDNLAQGGDNHSIRPYMSKLNFIKKS